MPGISNLCSALSRARRPSRKYRGKYTKDYLRIIGLIDGNGVGSHDLDFIMNWLKGCYDAGLLTEEETGVSWRDYGSYEFYERMIRQIVNREGFGDLLRVFV